MLDARLNRNPLTTSAKFTIIIALAVTTLSLGAVSVSGTTAAPRSISDVVLTSPATLPIPSVNLDRRVPGTGAMPARQAGAAQTGAVIEGVLYDQFGGLLPGASVKLTGLRRGAAYSTVTDRGGAFAFRDLVADDYEMITELPGFTTVRNVIRAEPGSMVRRHITLPTGTISETVSVACSPSPDTSKRPTAPSAAVTPGVTQHPSAVQRGVEPKIPATFTGGIGGQIRAPRKLTHAWPRCPTGVAASTALVRLAGRIGIDGLITDLRDVSAQADPAYVASAMEAVRQWTFLPTLLNGAPIEVNITITVQYGQ